MANRPLKTVEILALANDFNFFPDHLYGETPEKTLNARLSEHIQDQGRDALFYRTGPGTYFLTDYAERVTDDQRFKVFRGVRRSKALKNECILVAPKPELQKRVFGKFVPYSEPTFRKTFDEICWFEPRHRAEENHSVKQFVTFSVVRNQDRYLIYQRGEYSTASKRLRGALSIGFGGHVADEDFTLFEQYGDALLANSSREILEELYLSKEYRDLSDVSDHSTLVGFINVDTSPDARQHIACLVLFDYRSNFEPGKNELSINGLAWHTKQSLQENFEKFDHWSKIIIRKLSLMGM